MHSNHDVVVLQNPPDPLLFDDPKRQPYISEKRNTINRKLSEPNPLNDRMGYMLMRKPKRKYPHKMQSNTKHNLCLFIWGTTYTEQRAQELRNIMDIYRSRSDVYFIMDHLRGVLQYEICNIPERCLFIKYDIKSRYKMSEKTMTAFQYLYDHKLYDKCNWIMKTDTDSYVDIDRFNDFLSHNYNANEYHYFGYPVPCADNLWMPQAGGYVISKAVLKDYQWKFTAMAPTEDCMFAAMVSRQLNLKVNTLNDAGFFMRNERVMENEWEQSKLNHTKWVLTECTFVWHKVTHSFRLQLVAEELKKRPYHTDHCKRIAL